MPCMYCPNCHEADWCVSKYPRKVVCVHCGSVFQIVRKTKESEEMAAHFRDLEARGLRKRRGLYR